MSRFQLIREKFEDENQNVVDTIDKIEYLEEAFNNLEDRKQNVERELNKTKAVLKDLLAGCDVKYLVNLKE